MSSLFLRLSTFFEIIFIYLGYFIFIFEIFLLLRSCLQFLRLSEVIFIVLWVAAQISCYVCAYDSIMCMYVATPISLFACICKHALFLTQPISTRILNKIFEKNTKLHSSNTCSQKKTSTTKVV